MQKVLEFLHGKKTIIIGVCAVVVTYLMKEKVMTDNLGLMIQSILAIIGGGADIATRKMFGVVKK